MKNFDYLKEINGLGTLYKLCNAAEETQTTDADACALNCRKALEAIVEIVYRLKKEPMGQRESLISLTTREPYTKLIADDEKLAMATNYVRKTGNIAAHSGGVTRREAFFSLLNIYNVVGKLLLRLELIEELANDGMTMAIVTHEMGFAKEVGTRVLFMDEGVIAEENEPREFFENPQNPRLQDFLSKVL